MPTSETSPFVMVLITLAAVVSLLAWWLSARNSRRTRALIGYLEQNQESYWRSQQRRSRKLNPIGLIEAYRRASQAPDPEFDTLRKSGTRAQISAIILATTLIALVVLGTKFWGWSW